MLSHLSAGSRFEAMPFFNQGIPSDYKAQGEKGRFCKIEDRPYFLGNTPLQVVGMQSKAAKITVGRHSEAQRNLRWLPFLAGRITYVPLRNDAIFTGIMTGCWLFTFTMNGEICLGHIGTDSDSAENTQGVKDAWKTAEKNGTIKTLKAFRPTDVVKGSVKVFGAVSANQTFYGIATTANGATYTVDQLASTAGVPAPLF